jgi:hypothetical protein
MGINGRRYIVKNLSREKTARDYIAVLGAMGLGAGDPGLQPVTDEIEADGRIRRTGT